MDNSEIIEQYYNEYNFPSVEKLYNLMKDDNIKITKKEIKEHLNKKSEVQILKETKQSKQKLGKIVSFKPNSIWNMDIFYLQKYHKKNHGYKYILCVIDIFTRMAYAEPIKTKDNNEVLKAFENIIKKSNEPPYVIFSDNDSTFLSKKFQNYLDNNKILLKNVSLNDHHSLGIIDNFAKRIKIAFHKNFIKSKTLNWVDYLDIFIKQYNNTPHSSLNDIKPKNASEIHNAYIIYQLNKEKSEVKTTYKSNTFKPNDKVRIIENDVLNKKSEGKWSNKIYEIEKVQGKNILLTNGKLIKYDQILKIDKNTLIEENIIKKSKKDYKQELQLKKEDIQEVNIRPKRILKQINYQQLNKTGF